MERHRHNQRSKRRQRSDLTNPVVDSNCREHRVRGTLTQVIEKWETLASETEDKSIAEAYKQQAEHFQRMRNKLMENRND